MPPSTFEQTLIDKMGIAAMYEQANGEPPTLSVALIRQFFIEFIQLRDAVNSLNTNLANLGNQVATDEASSAQTSSLATSNAASIVDLQTAVSSLDQRVTALGG